MTGRENIYANMSILGLSKKQIDERFDEVVEFAEIGDAIDSPVQSYSSGMAARLGFACAIHTEPDILLIDEVLAVGDIRFRQKCHRRLAKLRDKGVSFILVSHNSQVIFSSCRSAVYLSKGKCIDQGTPSFIINQYEKDLFLDKTPEQFGSVFLSNEKKSKSHGLDIRHLLFRDNKGNIIKTPMTGEQINFCIGCEIHEKLEKVNVYLLISEQGGEGDIVLSIDSSVEGNIFSINPGNNEISLNMSPLCLKPGIYIMKVIIKKDLLSTLDYFEKFFFTVDSNKAMNRSLFYQPRNWNIESK
ncbi:MAG: ABC transporter ATP-binding protein [Richelia sp. RM2_1_2]|nr:ABC transporter ATP-binding protein [Richelia sp. RM2_1_2]